SAGCNGTLVVLTCFSRDLSVNAFRTVIPAKLAIASASRNPGGGGALDSRFRGNDGNGMRTIHRISAQKLQLFCVTPTPSPGCHLIGAGNWKSGTEIGFSRPSNALKILSGVIGISWILTLMAS